MARYKYIAHEKLIGNRLVRFKRNIHKSVRFDDDIYKYIMSFDGDDFTDKLENLVINHAELTGRVSDIF